MLMTTQNSDIAVKLHTYDYKYKHFAILAILTPQTMKI